MTALTLLHGRGAEHQKEWGQGDFVLKQLRSALGTPVPNELANAWYDWASQFVNLASSKSSLSRIAWLLREAEPNWVSWVANEANVERAYFITEFFRRPWMLSLPVALVESLGRPISAEATNALKKLESAGADVRDWVEVGAYLTEHAALRQVMMDAVSDIRGHFPDAPLSLELYRDPEIKGQRYPIIYVHVAELREAHFAMLEQVGQALDRRLNGVSGWRVGVASRRPKIHRLATHLITMGFDWEEYVQLADFLQKARPRPSDAFTEEAAQRACVSRAYFGAFGLIKQWSTREGFKPKQDVTDHAGLMQFLRDQGFTDAARRLEELRRARNNCDYDDVVSGLRVRTKIALQHAQWLVSLARTNPSSSPRP